MPWREDSLAWFELIEPPDVRLPLFSNSAHSGEIMPAGFIAQAALSPHELLGVSDRFVNKLIGFTPMMGVKLLQAQFPRAWLDLNREPYELDPRLFDARLPAFANRLSLRVAAGLGTIPRIAGMGAEIYAQPLDIEEAMARIEGVYFPYHTVLARELSLLKQQYGSYLLLDWHSMPSKDVQSDSQDPEVLLPDIILGDRYGTSCSPQLVALLTKHLRDIGFSVGHNQPYAGGFITEHYGNPGAHGHAVQIEINRALYMNEVSLLPHEGFTSTMARLAAFMRSLLADVDLKKYLVGNANQDLIFSAIAAE